MTAWLLAIAATVLAVAVMGWCTWRCVRGMRTMRGTGRSCCGPAEQSDTEVELARLRAELADLRIPLGEHDTPSPAPPAA